MIKARRRRHLVLFAPRIPLTTGSLTSPFNVSQVTRSQPLNRECGAEQPGRFGRDWSVHHRGPRPVGGHPAAGI